MKNRKLTAADSPLRSNTSKKGHGVTSWERRLAISAAQLLAVVGETEQTA
jgi:hypothetical protein